MPSGGHSASEEGIGCVRSSHTHIIPPTLTSHTSSLLPSHLSRIIPPTLTSHTSSLLPSHLTHIIPLTHTHTHRASPPLLSLGASCVLSPQLPRPPHHDTLLPATGCHQHTLPPPQPLLPPLTPLHLFTLHATPPDARQ